MAALPIAAARAPSDGHAVRTAELKASSSMPTSTSLPADIAALAAPATTPAAEAKPVATLATRLKGTLLPVRSPKFAETTKGSTSSARGRSSALVKSTPTDTIGSGGGEAHSSMPC